MRDQAVELLLRPLEARVGEDLLERGQRVEVDLDHPLGGRASQHALVLPDALYSPVLRPDVLPPR